MVQSGKAFWRRDLSREHFSRKLDQEGVDGWSGSSITWTFPPRRNHSHSTALLSQPSPVKCHWACSTLSNNELDSISRPEISSMQEPRTRRNNRNSRRKQSRTLRTSSCYLPGTFWRQTLPGRGVHLQEDTAEFWRPKITHLPTKLQILVNRRNLPDVNSAFSFSQ